jgi:hypothetical protein
VPDYEIRVGGPIGRVVASCLPGFSTTAVPPATVLRGTVAAPDELRRILDLLEAHGLPPIAIHIDSRRWH